MTLYSIEIDGQRFKDDNALVNLARAGIGQGLMFNFGDEVEAAVRAPFSKRSRKELLSDIRDEVDEYRRDNPTAAFGAEAAGALAPTAAALVGTALSGGAAAPAAAASGSRLGLLAARALPKNALARAVATNAAGGAVSGAGIAEDNKLVGALGGAAAGGAIGGASRALLPKLSKTAKEAIDAGVNLTPGQAVGGLANRVEQLATSTLTGPAIGKARRAANDDYFPVAANRALSLVGKRLDNPSAAPNQIMDELLEKTNDAYGDAARLMNVRGDGAIILNTVARRELNQLDKEAVKKIRKAVNAVASELPKPKGDAMRQAISQLQQGVKPRLRAVDLTGDEILKFKNVFRENARAARKNGNFELAAAYERMQRGLVQAAGRASGPKVAAAVDAADALYRQVAGVIGPAMRKTPIDQAPRIMDLAREGNRNVQRFGRNNRITQQVMDDTELARLTQNTTPNSGTAERSLLQLIASGSPAFINPSFLAAQLAGLPYMTPQTTALLRQGILAPGRIGQALGGRFGAYTQTDQ
jgi:hypothetical protein